MQETPKLDVQGVDARRGTVAGTSLDEIRTSSKARIGRQSLFLFLLGLAAVVAAIGAVVAIIGSGRVI